MKKILCLTLTLLMVLSAFGSLTAGAEGYDKVA